MRVKDGWGLMSGCRNRFIIETAPLTREEAEKMAAAYTDLGHHQAYLAVPAQNQRNDPYGSTPMAEDRK
jgi:hypothetical protein